jgi:hypothetical protein
MEHPDYYDEDTLISGIQKGHLNYLDYVTRLSPEMAQEFRSYCAEHGIRADNHAASRFLDYYDERLNDDDSYILTLQP